MTVVTMIGKQKQKPVWKCTKHHIPVTKKRNAMQLTDFSAGLLVAQASSAW